MEKGEDLELIDVKEIADDFLNYYYDLNLDIPIKWSKKLKRRWGYFSYKEVEKDLNYNGFEYKKGDILRGSMEIVLNEKLRNARNRELVKKIIKHEVLHYALFKKGKPFKDTDLYFKKEIERLGLSRSKVSQKDLGIDIPYWVWECGNCGNNIIIRKGKTRKDYSKDRKSNCCGAKLKEVGWKYL